MLTRAFSVLIIIFLLYCFAGIFSFIPYLFGLIIGIFNFPVSLLSHFYPVGPFPYIISTGLMFGLFGYWILKLFKINS